MPEVSVIIPNYNHAKYLTQRLESIITQTFQDFEIIILDDCSTDKSKDIIECYKDHRKVTHIVYNEQNSGSPFLQWAKGINLAKGKYIWIAESDDWCEPTFLAHLLHGIKSEPDGAIISYCQSYCVEETNKIMWQSSHRYLSEVIGGTDFIRHYLSYNNSIFNASMAIWKKEAFQNVDNGYLSLKFCGDWYFWIEICRQGKVCISGRLLNYFRKHADDLTSKSDSSGLTVAENLIVLQRLRATDLVDQSLYKKILRKHKSEFFKIKGMIPEAQKKYIEQIMYRNDRNKTKRMNFYADNLLNKIRHLLRLYS